MMRSSAILEKIRNKYSVVFLLIYVFELLIAAVNLWLFETFATDHVQIYLQLKGLNMLSVEWWAGAECKYPAIRKF